MLLRYEQAGLAVPGRRSDSARARSDKGDYPMRTGMEPFLDFCSAVIYAAQQIRIEYHAWQSYLRNQSPRNVNSKPGRQVNGGLSPIEEQL